MNQPDLTSMTDLPADIAWDLTTITAEIVETCGPVRAVVLGGSFGRSEGGVVNVGDRHRVLNDYDIFVISDRPLNVLKRRALRRLREDLASRLGVRHVDIILFTRRELISRAPSMLRYDLKFGSRVLFGDSAVTDLIPFDHGEVIAAQEIENLLINRMVTLLEAFPSLRLLPSVDLCERQMSKVDYAVIDMLTNSYGMYRTRYGDKEEALRMIPCSPLQADLLRDAQRRIAAWKGVPLSGAPDEVQILRRWERCRARLIEALINFRGADLGQTGIEALLLGWRAGHPRREPLFRQIWGALSGRESHRQVEKRIFAALATYPTAARFSWSGGEVPAAFEKSSVNADWVDSMKRLVRGWYAS